MISQGPEATLDEVRKMLTAAPTKLTGTRAAIVREFKGSVGQIDLRLASERGDITLGGGPVNGTYQAFSDAFSRFATAQGVPVHSFSSEGSVENASRIQAGSLDFALVQSDVAQLFYRGWVDKTVLPSHDLRTVASLWPEAVHLITLDGSGIETIADLKGRRLAIGVRGSGTRLNALILGLAAGLGEDEVPQIREIGRDKAIRALERGEIDALFLTEAVPAPSLQRLARRRRDVKLVPIDVALVESLSERFFPYYPLVIEARTYPLQDSPYITLGLAAVLMTNQHVADEAVVQMLELLLRGSDEMASQYYRAAFVTRETMRLGVEVPLHAAAQQFYNDEEVGELVTPGEGVAELSDSTQVSPEH
jgi:TRAP transporter TAXI family solute receptor